MENELLPTMYVESFFDIAKSLELGERKYVRTDDVADSMAEAVKERGFLVRYDKVTAPVIDAAVMRNIDNKEDEEEQRDRLDSLRPGEYIILQNVYARPVSLTEAMDAEAWPAHFLTYDDCVGYAELTLNDLLRFSGFEYDFYYLYVGAAYAIVQAEHPDWCYDTFIECFRKDVVDRMAERTEHYLGYKAFADEKG